ncbi:YggS family pyridoxal phosphate-dependent enzyme [Chryseomicrobium sp. FSL W7-1435]|uniref:YggS family pyridoxal phosphate-dependent enzyme n=1 Tax=Chryseomicrobium sp. FSL W7-1435 TaxID=2921704 RepID=UPI003159A764
MIQLQIQQIQDKIKLAKERSAASANSVQVIAVTKQLSIEKTQTVIESGLLHLGENRPQSFLEKVEALDKKISWHFIGSLQTRKVRDVIDHINYLHSLDRMSLATEIQKRASQPVRCFIQVNVSGEESKHGLPMQEVQDFINAIKEMDRIVPVGFMTMAPLNASPEAIRIQFKTLRELRDDLIAEKVVGESFTELSMGMSDDYEIAVEEGATYVRIGTALVGSLKE